MPEYAAFLGFIVAKYPEHVNDAEAKEQLTKLNSLTHKEAEQLFGKLKPKCPKSHDYCQAADSEKNKQNIGEPCDVKLSAKCTNTVKIPYLFCNHAECKTQGK